MGDKKAIVVKTFLTAEEAVLSKLKGLPHFAIAESLKIVLTKLPITDVTIRQEIDAQIEEFKSNPHECVQCLVCQLAILIAVNECDAALDVVVEKLVAGVADVSIVGSEGILEGGAEVIEVLADALLAISGAVDCGISDLLLPEAVVGEEALDVAGGAAVGEVELKAKKIVLHLLNKVLVDLRGKIEKKLIAEHMARRICQFIGSCDGRHFYKAVQKAHIEGHSLIPSERGGGIKREGLDPAMRNRSGGATVTAAAQTGRAQSESDKSIGQCLTGDLSYAIDYAEQLGSSNTVILRVTLYKSDLSKIVVDAASRTPFDSLRAAAEANECTAIEVIPPEQIDYYALKEGHPVWEPLRNYKKGNVVDVSELGSDTDSED